MSDRQIVQAIVRVIGYVRTLWGESRRMTIAQVDEYRRMAEEVYVLAFRSGLTSALPNMTDLRSRLEVLPDRPVQFVGKLNLPGDWNCRSSNPSDHYFLPSPSPWWFEDMAALLAVASTVGQPGADKVAEVMPGEPSRNERRRDKVEVMPSAAKNTTGAGKGDKLPGPEPYPVHDKKVEKAVKGVQKMIEGIADRIRPAGQLPARSKADQDDDLPWGGPEWEGLSPQIRRLLRYMHGRDSARVEDFTDFVWEKNTVSNLALNTAVCRANRFLLKQKYDHHLEKVRGEPIIRWV